MKKLLLLGGSRYLIPVIESAHKLGLYTITCDYLPDNIAHRYSDEYWNLSIIEKGAVFSMAAKKEINGVMSFACDPGVVTAAYIAERMGLPFQCSYESACILQDKGRFRKFLSDNGFNTPYAKRYTDLEAPFREVDSFTWPVIVKPVDSAGSKGVTRVDTPDRLKEAIRNSIAFSHSNAFIIEDFLSIYGYRSDADPIVFNGQLCFTPFSDQLFDLKAANPYTPAMIIWPSSMEWEKQAMLTKDLQRFVGLLQLRTGIYNVETCVSTDGRCFLMEVSPRGGGNRIAEIQKLAYGIDLIDLEVRKAVGLPVPAFEQKKCEGHWCEFVIHAEPDRSGRLRRIVIDPEIEEKFVRLMDFSVKQGDMVLPFTGANMALGDMFLRFDSREELDDVMAHSREWLRIEIEEA